MSMASTRCKRKTQLPHAGAGNYAFCARARDQVGNWEVPCNTDEVTVTYNTDAPAVRVAGITPGPYAYAVGSSVYYNGNRSGWFSVTAQATNTGGGLQFMRFPTTTSTGVLSTNVTANGWYG